MKKHPKYIVESESFLSTPVYGSIFNVGDRVFHPSWGVATISDIYADGDKSKPEWYYNILGIGNFSQSQLEDMWKRKELTRYEDLPEEESISVEDTLYEMEGVSEYEAIVDDQIDRRYSEQQPEAISVKGDDINFRLLGFTFNNQYLADSFDEDGNLELTEIDDLRIDNGYGLHKLNPAMFNTRNKIKKAIGTIRRYLEFSSN